jgi:tetratricopeptide (TPR) repeat protein
MRRLIPSVSNQDDKTRGADDLDRDDPCYLSKLKRPRDAGRLLRAIDRAQHFLRYGLLRQAVTILRKGCLKYPYHAALAIQSARFATAREDWPEAVTRWRKVIETLPVAAALNAHRALSQAYRKQAQFALAEAVLHAAIDLYPDDLPLAVEYAEVAGLRKNWREAVVRWSDILVKFGQKVPIEAYVSLSKAYRTLGQFDAAEATIHRAQRRAPLLLMELAAIAMARKDIPEAIKRWNFAITAFGDDVPADARLRLALAYRLEGNFEAATKQLSLTPTISLSGYGPIAQTIERNRAYPAVPDIKNTICVHLHLYHTRLADPYLRKLSHLNIPFGLLVSVPQGESEVYWRDRVSEAIPTAVVEVKAVPNRGRDVMPWVCIFASRIKNYDLMLHMHTKASLQSSKAILWNEFLLDNVCGTPTVVYSILDLFERDADLGLVYPPYFFSLKRQPNWDGSREVCQSLYARLFSESPPACCPDYPAGSFFWARTQYLKPLLDLGLSEADFPAEEGQTDNTLAHAVERIIGALDWHTGMTKKCVATAPLHSMGGS